MTVPVSAPPPHPPEGGDLDAARIVAPLADCAFRTTTRYFRRSPPRSRLFYAERVTELGRRRALVDHPGLIPGALLPPEDPSAGVSAKRTVRDWIVDVAAFVLSGLIGAVVLILSLNAASHPVAEAMLLLDLVIGSIGCSLLWLRRRWPIGTGVALVVVNSLSAFGTAAALVAVFSVAVHRRTYVALGVATANLLGGAMFALMRPMHGSVAVVLILGLVSTAAMLVWGMLVRARRQLVWSLRERTERAEAEQRMLADRARMSERSRIAREMHDVLAHRISLVALHAGALELRPDLPPLEVRETAELLRSTARQALEELRDVIGVLRDEGDPDAGLAAPQPTLAHIERLIAENRRAGAKIEFELSVVGEPPTAVGRAAYRIVQEALTNVNKHARGTATNVRVSGDPERGLTVSVRNRLPLHAGGASSGMPSSGMGLLGLRERVTLAGGTLEHGPDSSGVFVVEARLRWTR